MSYANVKYNTGYFSFFLSNSIYSLITPFSSRRMLHWFIQKARTEHLLKQKDVVHFLFSQIFFDKDKRQTQITVLFGRLITATRVIPCYSDSENTKVTLAWNGWLNKKSLIAPMACEKILKEWLGFQQAGKRPLQRMKTAHEHWKWITLYTKKVRVRKEFAQGYAASQWQ